MNHQFTNAILRAQNLQLVSKNVPLSIGRSFRVTPLFSSPSSSTPPQILILHVIAGEYYLHLRRTSTTPTTTVVSTDGTSNILHATRFFDLKQQTPCYAAVYEIPAHHISFFEYCLTQSEQFAIPHVSVNFEQSLSLLNAITSLKEQRNKTPDEGNAFLMDQCVNESIWVNESTKQVIVLDTVIVKDDPTDIKQIKIDKDIIYNKLNENNARNKPTVFLHSPAILHASLDLNLITPLVRKDSDEIWAFGVLLLMLLRCNPMELQTQIKEKKFPILNCSAEIQKRIDALFADLIFVSQDSNKKYSLTEIHDQIKQIIQLDKETHHYYNPLMHQILNDELVFDKNNKKEEIISEIKEKLDRQPEDILLQKCMGKLRLISGENNLAQSMFLQVIRSKENDHFSLHYLGQIEESMGHNDKAIQYYTQSHTANQWRIDSLARAAELLVQSAIFNNFLLAYELLHKATNVWNPKIIALTADCYLNTNQIPRAIQNIQPILHLRKEYKDRLIEYTNKQMHTDPNTRIQKGDILFLQGEYEETIKFYNQNLLEKPPKTETRSRMRMSQCYLILNQIAEAQKHVNAYWTVIKGYSVDEFSKNRHLLNARIQSKQKNPYQAIQFYLDTLNQMNQIEPNDPEQPSIFMEFLAIMKKFVDETLLVELLQHGFPFHKQAPSLTIGMQLTFQPQREARKFREYYVKCFADTDGSFNVKIADSMDKVQKLLRSLAMSFLFFTPNRARGIALMTLIQSYSTENEFDFAAILCEDTVQENQNRGKLILEKEFGSILRFQNNDHLSSKEKKLKRVQMEELEKKTKNSPKLRSIGYYNLVQLTEDMNAQLGYARLCLESDAQNIDCWMNLVEVFSTLKLYQFEMEFLREELIVNPYNHNALVRISLHIKSNRYKQTQGLTNPIFDLPLFTSYQSSNKLLFTALSHEKLTQIFEQFKLMSDDIQHWEEQIRLEDFEAALRSLNKAHWRIRTDKFIEDSIHNFNFIVSNKTFLQKFLDHIDEFPQKFSQNPLSALQFVSELPNFKESMEAFKTNADILLRKSEEESKAPSIFSKDLPLDAQFNYYLQQEKLSNTLSSDVKFQENCEHAISIYEQPAFQESSSISNSFKGLAALRIAACLFDNKNCTRSRIRHFLREFRKHSTIETESEYPHRVIAAYLIEIAIADHPVENLVISLLEFATTHPFETQSFTELDSIEDCVFNINQPHNFCEGLCSLVNAINSLRVHELKNALKQIKIAIKDKTAIPLNLAFTYADIQYANNLLGNALITCENILLQDPLNLYAIHLSSRIIRESDAKHQLSVNLQQSFLRFLEYSVRPECQNESLLDQKFTLVPESKSSTLQSSEYVLNAVREFCLLSSKSTIPTTVMSDMLVTFAYICECNLDYETALKIAAKTVETYPTNLRARFEYSRLQIEDVETSESDNIKAWTVIDECLDTLITTSIPKVVRGSLNSESEFLYQIGKFYSRNSKYSRANLAFQKCIEIDKYNLFVYQHFGHSIRQQVIVSQKLSTKAIASKEASSIYNQMNAENAHRKQLQLIANNGESMLELGQLLVERPKFLSEMNGILQEFMPADDSEARALLIHALNQLNGSKKNACYSSLTSILIRTDARKCIEFMDKQSKDFPETKIVNHLEIAKMHHWRYNEFEKALVYYQSYLECNPNDAAIHYQVALLLLGMKKDVEASDAFVNVVKSDPSKWECHFRIAEIQIDRNQAIAQHHLQQGFKVNPDHAKGLVLYSRILSSQGKYEQVVDCLEKALYLSDGRILSIYGILGDAYRKLNNVPYALACYQVSADLVSPNDYIILNYATMLLKEKRLPQIRQIIEKYYKGGQQFQTRQIWLLAESYYLEQDFKRAIQQFELCLSQPPCLESIYSARRILFPLLFENKIPTLKKLLDEYLSKNPKDQGANILYAEIYMYLGKLKEASSHLLFNEEELQKKNLTHFYLASARYLSLIGKHKQAVDMLETKVGVEKHQATQYRLLLAEILIASSIDPGRGVLILDQIPAKEMESVHIQTRYLRSLFAFKSPRGPIGQNPTQLLDKNPAHVPSLLLKAELLTQKSKDKEAQAILTSIDKMNIEHIPTIKAIALNELQVANYANSIKYVDIYAKSMHVDAFYKHTKATCQMMLKNYKDAEYCILTQQYGGNIVVTEEEEKRIALVLIEVKLKLKKYKDTINLSEEYLHKYNEKCPKTHLFLAEAYRESGLDINESVDASATSGVTSSKTQRLNGSPKERGVLERGRKFFPNHKIILQQLGNLYQRIGEVSLLKELSAQLLSLKPTEVEILLDLGCWSYSMNDMKGARDQLLKIQDKIPNNMQCLRYLLNAMYSLNETTEFNKLILANPNAKFDDHELIFIIVTKLYSEQQFKPAIHWLLKIVSKDHQVILEKDLFLAKAMYNSKQFKPLDKHIEKLYMKLDRFTAISSSSNNETNTSKITVDISGEKIPMHEFLTFLQVSTKVSLSEDPSKLLTEFSERLKSYPNSLLCQSILCYLQIESATLPEAEESLLRIESATLKQSSASSIPETNFISKTRFSTESLHYYFEQKRIEDYLKAHTTVSTETKSNMIKELIQNITDKHQKRIPSELELYILIKCYFELKEYGSILKHWEIASKKQHAHIEEIYAKPLTINQWYELKFSVARSLFSLKMYPKAVKAYQACLEMQPGSIPLQVMLAESYFEQDMLTETTKILYQIIFKFSASAESFVLFARVQIKQTYFESASSYLRKALLINPNLEEARTLLGSLSEQIGDDSEHFDVIGSLEILYKSDPNNPQVVRKLIKYYNDQCSAEDPITATATPADPSPNNEQQQNPQEQLNSVLSHYESIVEKVEPEFIAIRVRILIHQNQLETANNLLTSNLLDSPNDPYLLFALGQLQHIFGDFEAEIASYHNLLAKSRGSISIVESNRVNFSLATAHMHVSEFSKAEHILETLLKSQFSQQKGEYLINRGICEIALSKTAAAIATLKQALTRMKANPTACFYLAFAQTQAGELKSAIISYKRCLDFSPNFMPAALNLANLLRRQKDYHNAELVLKNLKKIYPNHLSPLFQLAITYFKARSPSQAVSCLLDILDNFKEKQRITNKINTQLDQLGFFNVMKKFNPNLFGQVATLHKHTKNASNSAQNNTPATPIIEAAAAEVSLVEEGENAATYESFESTFSNPLDETAVNLLLGVCYKQSQQFEQGIRHLQMCLDSDPTNIHYCYNLAQMHGAKVSGIPFAESLINRCIELRPQSKRTFMFALARMYRSVQMFTDEMHMLEDCVETYPDFHEAATNLGCAYMQRRMHTKAVAVFMSVVNQKPKCAEAYFNLGNALAKTKEIDAAIKALLKCEQLDPNHMNCLNNLSAIYAVQAEYATAIEYLNKYIEITHEDNDYIANKLVILHKRLLLSQIQH